MSENVREDSMPRASLALCSFVSMPRYNPVLLSLKNHEGGFLRQRCEHRDNGSGGVFCSQAARGWVWRVGVAGAVETTTESNHLKNSYNCIIVMFWQSSRSRKGGGPEEVLKALYCGSLSFSSGASIPMILCASCMDNRWTTALSWSELQYSHKPRLLPVCYISSFILCWTFQELLKGEIPLAPLQSIHYTRLRKSSSCRSSKVPGRIWFMEVPIRMQASRSWSLTTKRLENRELIARELLIRQESTLEETPVHPKLIF